jgi:hypothetical protein
MPNVTTPNTQNVEANIAAIPQVQLEDVSGGCHPRCCHNNNNNNNIQPINIYNVNGNGSGNSGPIPQYAPPQYAPQYYGPQSYGPQSYGPQSYGPQVQTDFSMQYR